MPQNPNDQDSSDARQAVSKPAQRPQPDPALDQKPAKKRDLSDLTKQVNDNDLHKSGW